MRDHQIVDDAAIRVCKKRVTLPPSRKPDDIDRNKALERRCNIGQLPVARPQRDLTHVRDVKQTCMRARVQVLFHNARRILDWHFVAREGAHSCAPCNVQIVKRRALQRGVLSERAARSLDRSAACRGTRDANEAALLKGCAPLRRLWYVNGVELTAASGHLIGSYRSFGAPSVSLPENVIPSADAQHLFRERRASFQSLCHCAVHLPESFRGGCSFGAGSGPVSPAAMRTLECYLLCIEAQVSIGLRSNCHPFLHGMWNPGH